MRTNCASRLVSIACVSHERGFPYFEVWAHSLLAEVEVDGAGTARCERRPRPPSPWPPRKVTNPPSGRPTRARYWPTATCSRVSPNRPAHVRKPSSRPLRTCARRRSSRSMSCSVPPSATLASEPQASRHVGRPEPSSETSPSRPPCWRRSPCSSTGPSWLSSGPAAAVETAEWLERRVGKVGEVLLMDAWAHLYDGQYEAASAAVEPIAVGAVAALVPHTPIEVHLVQAEAAAAGGRHGSVSGGGGRRAHAGRGHGRRSSLRTGHGPDRRTPALGTADRGRRAVRGAALGGAPRRALRDRRHR